MLVEIIRIQTQARRLGRLEAPIIEMTGAIDMGDIHILSAQDPSVPIANAVVHNGLVYVSGMVGFKPGTMELISGDFRLQSREVFRRLEEALVQCKSSASNILMIRVFLADIRRDFGAFNEEFIGWLGNHRPARTTVEAKLAMEGLLIEADCIGAVEET